MRTSGMLALLLACAAGTVSPALRAQERSPAEVRLQAAIHTEEVEGNLQRAIDLYRDVVRRYGGERDVAARALLYLGRTYEKLGSQEATRAYQRVVREYGDQSQVAAQARARLAALQAAAPAVAGHGPVARRLLTDEDAPLSSIAGMSPSPDGRRVAYFDGEGGRLLVRDLASGAEEQMIAGLPTAATAGYWSPVWSPDGTRLAFVERAGETSVQSIKILDLTSRTVTAVQGTEVSASARAILALQDWSRDGRFLRYWYGPMGMVGEMGIVPAGGGARRVLAEGVSWGGRLSPDSRYVAHTAGEPGSEQLVVQEVGGGARRQITSEPGGNRLPEWSPDGNSIAYVRRDGVWVVPIAGGEAAGAPRLAYASGMVITFRSPVWTAPGSLHLLLSFDEYIPQRIAVDLGTGAVSAAVEQLPRYSLPGRGLWEAFKWSPDQRQTAFATGVGDIVISGANGANVASHTVAPHETLFVEGWSGDGREIFFTRYSATRATAALDVASGRVREIGRWTYPAVVRSVSADGRRILLLYHGEYGQDQPGATPRGLVVVEPSQPGGTLVAPAWDADSLPLQWVERMSAQGDRVAFARSARRGNSDGESLWIVGTDGAGLRRLATLQEIGHVLWDPSGRFVAYAGRPDSTTVVLRIVDVATGVERGGTRLPSELWGKFMLCDWSGDGRFIGLVAREPRMEYWVVQGLLEGGR